MARRNHIIRNNEGKFEATKDFKEMMEYSEVTKWINGLSEKPANRKRVMGVLEEYWEFTKKTPKELIDEIEIYTKLPTIRNQTNPAKTSIKNFYDYCIKTYGNSPNSARWKAYSVICGFYSANEFHIKWRMQEKPPKTPPTKEKAFRLNSQINSDMRGILLMVLKELRSLRDRTILCFMASGGLDCVDLFAMKYNQMKDWLAEDKDFVVYEYKRQKIAKKMEFPAVCSFSREAIDYLRQYLEMEYPQPIQNEDYVFIVLGKEKYKKKPITEEIFSKEIKYVTEKLNIQNVTPKSTRRFVSSILYKIFKEHTIPESFHDLWLGHTQEMKLAYDMWVKYPEEVLKNYAYAIPELTLGEIRSTNGNHTQILELDQEIKQLKQTYESEIAELKAKQLEYQSENMELKQKLDAFEHNLNRLNQLVISQNRALIEAEGDPNADQEVEEPEPFIQTPEEEAKDREDLANEKWVRSKLYSNNPPQEKEKYNPEEGNWTKNPEDE